MIRIAQKRSCASRGRFCKALPRLVWSLVAGLTLAAPGFAAERVTLQNGFDMVCDHRVVDGDRTRLYMDAASTSFVEVGTSSIATDELLPAAAPASPAKAATHEVLSAGELHEVLTGAGTAHHLDVDLLLSVVHAESAGRVHARSRVGAEGLMQLMPATAATLGVHDPYAPADNVGGGAAYLDSLLTRYHDNLALALAAYNAGPGAVARWHGVPPYAETRRYVARIIREFNALYAARQAQALRPSPPATPPADLAAAKEIHP